MRRREVVVDAVQGILRRAGSAELAKFVTAETLAGLQDDATATLRLSQDDSCEAKTLVDGVCGLSRRCIAVCNEAGLFSAHVAEIVSESLAAVAHVCAPENGEVCWEDPWTHLLKEEHKSAIGWFLEAQGEIFDTFAIEIFQGLRRLEGLLRPQWTLAGGGQGGSFSFAAEQVEPADAHLYNALHGVCMWALALVVRAAGYKEFTARSLWQFASREALFALVFAKGALCCGQCSYEPNGIRLPEDLPHLRDSILGAMLSLNGQDIAFSENGGGNGGNAGLAARDEQLLMHHAKLAEAFVDCNVLDCVLAYPWSTGLMGADLLPSLAAFLQDLLVAGSIPRTSPFMEHLGQKCEACANQLRGRGAELWSLVAPLAAAKNDLTRLSLPPGGFPAPPAQVSAPALHAVPPGTFGITEVSPFAFDVGASTLQATATSVATEVLLTTSPAAHGLDGLAGIPSLGSYAHLSGQCSRCCFHPKGRCANGFTCQFCHFDHDKRPRNGKKKRYRRQADGILVEGFAG